MAMCARHEIEYGRPSDDCERCDTAGATPTSQTHQIGKLPDDVWDRYRDVREESRARMAADELTNTEFVSVLLDVYALHLEDSP